MSCYIENVILILIKHLSKLRVVHNILEGSKNRIYNDIIDEVHFAPQMYKLLSYYHVALGLVLFNHVVGIGHGLPERMRGWMTCCSNLTLY